MGLQIAAGTGVAHALGQHMEGKKAPPPPDFQGAADAQSQGSQVNMSGPFSQQQWTVGPDGRPMLASTFNGPLGQAATNLQQQAASQGPAPTGMEARQQAIDAAFGDARARLDPLFEQRESSLQQQLANQGLDPNSEAAQKAMSNFGAQRNDAYSSALANAIAQGTSAGNAIFGQGLASQQLPYQQMAMLQALQGQQFGASAGGFQGPQDLAAAIAGGNYGLTAQQIQNQAWSDLFSGGGDAGAGILRAILMGGG